MSDPKFETKTENKKAEDQLIAIRTREQVCDDPDVSDGSVRLFARVLDMALNPFLNNNRRGEIIVSQMKLGCLLNCDERTIRRRTDELIRGGYVWTTLVPRQNTKPILCYHITAFQAKRPVEQQITYDGLWGNGKRRFDSGFTKTGKQASGHQTGHQRPVCSALLDQFGKQISFNYLENTPASGQNCPLSPDKIDRSHRTKLSSGSGQICPVTEDTSVLSQRSKLSGGSGQNCPVTPDASVRLKESQQEVKPPLEKENPLSVQRVTALKKTALKKKGGAKVLLEDVARVFTRYSPNEARTELLNWGGWWTNRYREDPDKTWRVLAEVGSMITEGKIEKGPGKTAVDLWKRLP